jgi:hypothetical protein
MAWFAAHAVLYFKTEGGGRGRVHVWENVYLIEAEDVDAAWEKAEARAREEEGDDDGTLEVDGRPATLVFAGLRKLSELYEEGEARRPVSGDEITYAEFEVRDEDAVRAFVEGREVSVTYAAFESEEE